ncbi:uncharacterized protein [Linepithema humile]|uniref:uncharacterized protein isoform X5 n=1 Tax=Linepithema humile TaxID=83485 RepID=UPI00062358E3|nr:PREDICTED: uncharacterized protein LOC105674517 [Linepithema humile]XP_012226303.1 PREDICTED: uncharacterized protein LOC105674517 [Linepithema humile]XP_012226305.1 PREDICTED: uncharacterized protein LOC105674517 [Linepithema humile]XP_012226306.1 PREDICTED: uncharacterized protein LOC105674517 [Linepithema humile]XP_012226307.1 PREDICTED: uncharacterized protein LOC105674517 [Linepithema humile]XP_012226308.1 PREDICTED: uncharacterized protein LOC105674517 [Linepithema humile]
MAKANVTFKKQITATAVDDDDDTLYYIGVKASPFASDSAIFGLPPEEVTALRSRFPLCPSCPNVVNGIMFKGSPFSIINALAELGYRVTCSTGEAEILWTLQRELN